jgi:hypothetical protein
MSHSQETIDLATRIQRRRDFTAHLIGFVCGGASVALVLLMGIAGMIGAAITVFVWGAALSLQHFSQVFRGAITVEAVQAEAWHLSTRSLTSTNR